MKFRFTREMFNSKGIFQLTLSGSPAIETWLAAERANEALDAHLAREWTSKQDGWCMECGQISPEKSFLAGLAAGRAENKWKPIETAPRDIHILVSAINLNTGVPRVMKEKLDKISRRHGTILNETWKFTHWMPLPLPPEKV